MVDEVEIRIKYGGLELEIKGNRDDVDYFLEKVMDIIEKAEHSKEYIESSEEVTEEIKEKISGLPSITIKTGEPLSNILTKLFSDKWGREPRNLREVIEALETYGLYYPKSTVAVTLNRLVKRGILRRIKGKDGTYRYVYSGRVLE